MFTDLFCNHYVLHHAIIISDNKKNAFHFSFPVEKAAANSFVMLRMIVIRVYVKILPYHGSSSLFPKKVKLFQFKFHPYI